MPRYRRGENRRTDRIEACRLSRELLEGGADLLLTELNDRRIAEQAGCAFDLNPSAEGELIDGFLRLATVCFRGRAAS